MPTHSNRLTVLLPDHPDGWQAIVRTLLQPQGVTTVTVRTGREALDLLESTTVHLAVLDANMPQLSGLQVLKLLREHNPNAKTPPAILLAQQLTNHLLHDALGMQVFSVLSKPVDLNILLDTMARVLKRYHESRWPNGTPPTTTNS